MDFVMTAARSMVDFSNGAVAVATALLPLGLLPLGLLRLTSP